MSIDAVETPKPIEAAAPLDHVGGRGADAPSLRIDEQEMYIGYSCDDGVRAQAASGGLASAILLHLMDTGQVDGAIVSRIVSRDGAITGVSELARTREDVLNAAGSSYIDTPVWQAVKALREFDGRVAVVTLPCQARLMRKLLAKDEALRARVAVIIGLFCRGTVTEKFYEDLLPRYGVDPSQVARLKVVRTHIKGTVTATLHDGQTRDMKFHKVNAYRMAGIHAKALCLWCDEHLAAAADISVGDIFAPEIKQRPIKHSALVCRTSIGAQVIDEMVRGGRLQLERYGMDKYRSVFSEIEQYTNTLAPRYWAAKLTGQNAATSRTWRVNPLHVLSWTMYFLSYRLSKSPGGRRFIFKLPQTCIAVWALGIKLLSKISFRRR